MNMVIEKPKKTKKDKPPRMKKYPFSSSVIGLSGFRVCRMSEEKTLELVAKE